jgi:hypothetical protein
MQTAATRQVMRGAAGSLAQSRGKQQYHRVAGCPSPSPQNTSSCTCNMHLEPGRGMRAPHPGG